MSINYCCDASFFSRSRNIIRFSADFKSFVSKKYPTKHASPGPQERPGVKKLVSFGESLVFRDPDGGATAPFATGRSALTQNREVGLSGHFQGFNLSARIV